jgi:hypothetical protein
VSSEQQAIEKFEVEIRQVKSEISSNQSRLKRLEGGLAESKKRKAEAELVLKESKVDGVENILTQCKKRNAESDRKRKLLV